MFTLFFFILYSIGLVICVEYLPKDNLVPCKFFSTANITEGKKQPNGSIIYNNVEYLEHQYADYNYHIINVDVRVLVPEHTRGCLCEMKDCIRVCCGYGKVFKNQSCVEDDLHDVLFNLSIDLKGYENFGYIDGFPCTTVFERVPESEITDKWELLKVSLNLNIFVKTMKNAIKNTLQKV